MNNSTADEAYDLLEIIAISRAGLCDTQNQLSKDVKKLGRDFTRRMRKEAPKMNPSASRQQLLTAAQTCRDLLSEESIAPLVTKIFKPLGDNIRVLEKMLRVLGAHEATGDEHTRVIFHQKETEKKLQALTGQWIKYQWKLDHRRERLIQGYLQNLVQEHDEETREWFFMEVLAEYSSHVTPPKDSKEVVTVNVKKTVGLSLPSEILNVIFTVADLETCVSLRQVNTEFYELFQHNEHVFQHKLALRNPWMQPGDSISTWRDCVLVFVARLKWATTTDAIHTIAVPEKQEQRHTVVGFELGLDENLPNNFTGMQPDFHSCSHVACDHLHVFQGVNHFVRDLWTGQSRHEEVIGEVVSANDDTFTFSWENVEITIQTKDLHTFRGRSTPDVVIFPIHYLIPLKEGHLILPRDKPHFEHGFVFEEDGDVYEIGPLLYVQDITGRRGHHKFGVIDIQRKQTVYFPGGNTSAKLAACYNGLIWWQVKSTLVPTFIDLQSPDKVYYSEQKALTGLSESKFEQCPRSCDSHHFAVSLLFEKGIQVVDFASGKITFVSYPIDWDEMETDMFIVPGFLNGKFQARFMEDDVKREVERRVLQQFGVEVEDEFDDEFDED